MHPRTVFLVDEAAPRSARSNSENLRYSEIKSYRCAYGPEDNLHIPREKKRQTITKLGCQCRFEYRTLRMNPDVVCIHFVEQGHVTIDGRQSHGTSDDRLLNIHQYATKLSDEIKSWVFSRLVARRNPAQILAEHRENVLSRMQTEGIKYRTCKDDFLRLSNIQNVVSAVRKGTWRDRAQENRLVLERARPILGQSVARLWPARTRCEVLQDTNPNTISGRQVGAEKETVDLTSSSKLEAEEVPSSQEAVDQFPRVTRKPTKIVYSKRTMAMNEIVTRLPPGPFTRDDLIMDGHNTYYFQAGRFLDFLLGETNRIYPRTVFLLDKAAPRRSASEGFRYSEIKSYRCAYGPEDNLHTPSEKKRQMITKLGCQCRFECRKLPINPDVVCIRFVEQGHVTIDGRQSHGTSHVGFLDFHQYASRISDEIKSWVFSRLVTGLTPTQILAEHRENVLSRMQKEGIKYRTCKDDFLRLSNIQSVFSAVKKGTWTDRHLDSLTRLERAWPILEEYRQHVFGLSPARTRCKVLQDTNPNTISGRQVGTEKETVDFTSSSEQKAEEIPSSRAAVDQFPEVTSQPNNVGAYVREMAQGPSHGYYPAMFDNISEALKGYQTDHNKRKR